MPTEAERNKLFKAYHSARLPLSSPSPTRQWNFDTDAAESILSGTSKLTAHRQYDPHLSPFQPYHKLEIHYPALDVIDSEKNELPLLHMPHNAKERYQPLPLICDERIWENAGREKGPEAMFYTLWAAQPVIGGLSRRGVQTTNLIADVREVVRYVGKSVLKVVLFKTPSRGGPQIRIRRETYLRLKDDKREVEKQDFEMSLDDFLQKSKGVEEVWLKDVMDLIEIRTERAARHVQLMLYSWSRDRKRGMGLGAPALWERFCGSWRTPRRPDYGREVEGLARELGKTSAIMLLGKGCKICGKGFKSPGHVPVTLLCCQKIVAKSCFQRHLEETNDYLFIPPFAAPRCPCCEMKLFSDEEILAKNAGLDGMGRYVVDERCSGWENFERSCSDLDSHDPSTSRHNVTINPTLFRQIWTYISTQSIRKPEEEAHYQLQLMPEFKIFKNTIFEHVKHLSGQKTTIAHLYAFLQEQVRTELRIRFYEANLHVFLPGFVQRGSQIGDEEIKRRVMVRDGMEEFCNRILRRTLMFIQWRQCGMCSMVKDGVLFHQHEGRMYYDGSVAGKMAEVEGVREWQRTREGRGYVESFREFEG